MKNLSLLDCTLRDGGRIINCDFTQDVIVGIGKQLRKAQIDIIELGFLRGGVSNNSDSTFFTSVSCANKIVNKIHSDGKIDRKYVLFVDHGLYDVEQLEKASGNGISGIRYGFKKQDFYEKRDKLYKEIWYIKKQGYDLYLQDVNTIGYSFEEMDELICFSNEVLPKTFGIVDTYGAMYLDDLEKVWKHVEKRLDKSIGIDFHSHNNMQMSFALAQRIIQLVGEERNLIIDATLNGMGKCAGNLNTELIVDFLARKKGYDYDLDAVLDAIDRFLYPIKRGHEWGYTIPAFMAGIYKSHPNNVIYLTEKYRLNSKDIKYILSEIDEEKRRGYDYDNIDRVYRQYSQCQVDDYDTILELKDMFKNKKVLVLVPGSSVEKYYDRIQRYIDEVEPIVLGVNFVSKRFFCDFMFYANTIHWEKINDIIDRKRCIVTSNIHSDIEDAYIVNYSSLIDENSMLYDNSTIMLLNLLERLQVSEIMLAGFDGLRENCQNYIDNTFPKVKSELDYKKINAEVKKMYRKFCSKVKGKIVVGLLTPSKYK